VNITPAQPDRGPAIKEKNNFFKIYFLILLPFKSKNYFTLNNLSKYGHIALKFVGRYLSGFLQYGLFQSKNLGQKKRIVKIRFRLFYD